MDVCGAHAIHSLPRLMARSLDVVNGGRLERVKQTSPRQGERPITHPGHCRSIRAIAQAAEAGRVGWLCSPLHN